MWQIFEKRELEDKEREIDPKQRHCLREKEEMYR